MHACARTRAHAHARAHRPDSALEFMTMGYILPPPSTAAGHTERGCRSSNETKAER